MTFLKVFDKDGDFKLFNLTTVTYIRVYDANSEDGFFGMIHMGHEQIEIDEFETKQVLEYFARFE